MGGVMDVYTIALFGEAEKGEYRFPYLCNNLAQLVDYFGNPPEQSRGLFYAIQALLYNRQLLFFRVKEEGFSLSDYLEGFSILKNHQVKTVITAVCLPGVGNTEIIEVAMPMCKEYHSILITSEADFYDYLMQSAVEK
jgi:hypothetical protein